MDKTMFLAHSAIMAVWVVALAVVIVRQVYGFKYRDDPYPTRDDMAWLLVLNIACLLCWLTM